MEEAPKQSAGVSGGEGDGGSEGNARRMGRLAEEYGRPPRKYAEIEAALDKGGGTLEELAVGGELAVPEFNVLLRERFVRTLSRATSIGIAQSKKDKMPGLLGYRGRKCVSCDAKVQGRVLWNAEAGGMAVVKVVKNEVCKAWVDHTKVDTKVEKGKKGKNQSKAPTVGGDNRVESRYTARHLSMVEGLSPVAAMSKGALGVVEEALLDYLPPLAAAGGGAGAPSGAARKGKGKAVKADGKGDPKGESKGDDKGEAKDDAEDGAVKDEDTERGRRKKLYKDVLVACRTNKGAENVHKHVAAGGKGRGPAQVARFAAGSAPSASRAAPPKDRALAPKKPDSTLKPKDKKGKASGEGAAVKQASVAAGGRESEGKKNEEGATRKVSGRTIAAPPAARVVDTSLRAPLGDSTRKALPPKKKPLPARKGH